MFFSSWLQYLSPQQLIDMQNFKQFLLDNNIIATTAGVLIGYSAWDFIQSFVGDLIFPGLYFLIVRQFVKNEFVSSVFEPVNKLNLPKFFTRLISFTFVIIFTFLFIQYVIRNWVNAKITTTTTPTSVQGNVVVNNVPPPPPMNLDKPAPTAYSLFSS